VKTQVYRLNVKPKTDDERGIPKQPVPSLFIAGSGPEGDFNRWRHEKDSDNPEAAVLLFPLEMIEQLNAEGWPVKPGDLGENLTTIGIEYGAFAAGRKYAVGDELQIEISKACDPCKYLYGLPYIGLERGPAFVRTLSGRRGWYARVVRPGRVAVGDTIRILG
jgi:MOSC domain-containing protein YiiM